jgi:hypothetical protein
MDLQKVRDGEDAIASTRRRVRSPESAITSSIVITLFVWMMMLLLAANGN